MTRSATANPPATSLARRFAALLIALPLLFCGTGCNIVLLLGYLIGGPPSIEPDFEIKTKESLKGKKKTVLVLCYAPTELKWDNEAVDYDLSKHVAYQLNANKIRVIDPDRVQAWLDKNPNWDKPSQVGAAFGVDYVIYVDLNNYTLFEEHSANLYRGQADCIVSVIKMDEVDEKERLDEDVMRTREGESVYSKNIQSRYPEATPVSVDQFSYANFRKMYLTRLSGQIGQLFYESYAGDDIPHRVL
jgi:hypothetical protein